MIVHIQSEGGFRIRSVGRLALIAALRHVVVKELGLVGGDLFVNCIWHVVGVESGLSGSDVLIRELLWREVKSLIAHTGSLTVLNAVAHAHGVRGRVLGAAPVTDFGAVAEGRAEEEVILFVTHGLGGARHLLHIPGELDGADIALVASFARRLEFVSGRCATAWGGEHVAVRAAAIAARLWHLEAGCRRGARGGALLGVRGSWCSFLTDVVTRLGPARVLSPIDRLGKVLL